jgi:hypothetical protein
LGGERWDGEEEGEEEGETEEERKAECQQRQYNILDLPTASPTENSVGKIVGDSAGVSDTSLFGSPGLNPSVFLSEMRLKKIHVIPPLQFPKKKFLAVGDSTGIYRRNNSVGIYWRHRRRCFSVG